MCRDLRVLIGGIFLAMCLGCGREKDGPSAASPPTERPHAVNGRLILDEPTRQRLGIETAAVREQTIRQTLSRTGWLELPPASETVIRTPVAGFVMKPTNGDWPALGQTVAAQQRLSTVNVFLSPQEVSQLVQAKEETDIQMQQSLVSMRLAEEQLKRVGAAQDAVSGVRINELKEAFERSKAAYQESKEKLPFLIQEPYDDGVLMKPVNLDVPRAGRVLQVHVSPQQFVQAGDSLWTVADWSTLWLRVPVFEGDYERIMRDASVLAQSRRLREPITATPLAIPAMTKSGLRTIDLHYAVPNLDWQLRPGQTLTVPLPIGEKVSALFVPISAILYDGQGQAFVYAREEEASAFRRQRVELGQRLANEMVVTRGLDGDDIVVSAGAEVLYAEEFKGSLAVEDND